jgi:hypothetical protein
MHPRSVLQGPGIPDKLVDWYYQAQYKHLFA